MTGNAVGIIISIVTSAASTAFHAPFRLINVDDGVWPLNYEYDTQDRLITEHQGWATLRYRYNSIGQLSVPPAR